MTEQEYLAKVKALEDKLKASEEKNAELQTQISELQSAKSKSDTDAQLSAAGFKKDEDGKFAGISAATYEMLLSAKPEQATAMIADLTPKDAGKPDVPAVLLSDQGAQAAAGQAGAQLSANPLVADAQGRSKERKYV